MASILEFNLISHVKYILSKLRITDMAFLDSANRNKIIDFVPRSPSSTKSADSAVVEEDAPYELRISKMEVSKKIKDKAYEKLKTINR